MSQNAEVSAAQHRGFFGEVEDFGQALFHSAIENPINGGIQLIDHAAKVHLPELNIVGAPTHDSLGAKAGAVVGAAADLIGISIATGGVADLLGATGAVAGVATAAATGAIFGGVLTPSDANSKHFYTDRLTNGAIGAAAFATMNGAAQALGATGMFAMPGARSLLQSTTFGGLAGAAGGVATAEANAVLKEHKLVPSAAELAGKVGTAALFGATYGGLGYAYNQLAGPATRPVEVKDADHSITTINDDQGQPIKFKFIVLAKGEPDEEVVVNSTKMTDGTWKTSAYGISKQTGEWSDEANAPKVLSVTRADNGAVSVTTENGDIRTFADGQFTKTNPTAEARAAAAELASKYYDRTALNGNHEVSTTDGYWSTNPQGNTINFWDKPYEGNGANMRYSDDGSLSSIRLISAQEGAPGVHLENTGADTWKYTKGDYTYTWKGQIMQAKDPVTGATNSLSFKPESGEPVNFDLKSGTEGVANMISNTSQCQGINDGLAYARSNGYGDVFLRGGGGQKLTINGQPVTGETLVRPGDNVTVSVDVGDRSPEWETRQLQVKAEAGGKATLNGQEISGTKPIDISNFVSMKPTNPQPNSPNIDGYYDDDL